MLSVQILTLEYSVLIINFDEHGGFADHVPTPVKVPQPEDGIIFKGRSSNHNFTYDFTRLGVRYASNSQFEFRHVNIELTLSS